MQQDLMTGSQVATKLLDRHPKREANLKPKSGYPFGSCLSSRNQGASKAHLKMKKKKTRIVAIRTNVHFKVTKATSQQNTTPFT